MVTDQTVMDVEEIHEYLPHRYPALLVDRITGLEIGQSISGFKNITINEPFFQGHFPNHPIMPGVMIVEAMAQIAGILGFKTRGIKPSEGLIYYLAGVDKLRFRKPVRPGDRLHMDAVFLNLRRGIGKFDCRATVDGKLACGAILMIAEKEVPKG